MRLRLQLGPITVDLTIGRREDQPKPITIREADGRVVDINSRRF